MYKNKIKLNNNKMGFLTTATLCSLNVTFQQHSGVTEDPIYNPMILTALSFSSVFSWTPVSFHNVADCFNRIHIKLVHHKCRVHLCSILLCVLTSLSSIGRIISALLFTTTAQVNLHYLGDNFDHVRESGKNYLLRRGLERDL